MFDPDRLYPTDAPELRALASRGTMAIWRFEGRGPAWIKLGGAGRVLYEGRALNEWLDVYRVQPVETTK